MMRLSENRYPSGKTATPLVIAHGLFGSARNWNTLAGRFAAERPVIAVDMRNHGESPWDEAMDYPSMAADLAETIRAAGGRAVLLGHSMGGKAAMTLALSEPDLIEALIVADIAPIAYDHSHTPYIEAMLGLDLAAITRRSEADKALAEAIPDRGMRGFILQNLILNDGQPRWRPNLAVLAAAMDRLTGFPEPTGRFDGPAFFLRGETSDYVPPKAHALIRDLFPAVEIASLEGAGHFLHAERPDAFFAAVDGWLARLT